MNVFENRTKLRLIVGRAFTQNLNKQAFREAFTSQTGWTTKSPIVPTEYDIKFGEVYRTSLRALETSESSVVAIPVCFRNSAASHDRNIALDIVILTMRHGKAASDSLQSIDIDSISHEVTMAQVCECLAPKRWDLRDLAGDETTTAPVVST